MSENLPKEHLSERITVLVTPSMRGWIRWHWMKRKTEGGEKHLTELDVIREALEAYRQKEGQQ